MMRAYMLLLAASLAACGGTSPSETETGPGTTSGTTSGPGETCGAMAADGISVSTTDPYGGEPYALGFPPYAIDGCGLVYVAASGDLRVRDLATGGESTLEAAGEKPRRPAIAGDLVAWEATIGGRDVVRVRGPAGVQTITGTFEHAREPRVAKDTVVLTAWLGADDAGDTDVLLYTPSKGTLVTVAGGPGQQRFADVSETHVAWTDFALDPDGTFGGDEDDGAEVVVLERATGVVRPRKREGKQAFPALGAHGKIAYLDWGLVHPEPKFSEYEVRLGPLDGDGDGDPVAAHIITHVLYVRPAARGNWLAWVSAPELGGDLALMQRAVDLVDPAETLSVFADQSVFGPTASEAITLVGASPAGGAVTLRAFGR